MEGTVKVGDLELIVRPCQIEDIGFVYELMHHNMAGFFNRYTKEGWSRQKFKDGFIPARITIFEHGGMPVGFFDFEVNGDEAYHRNHHLSKDYWARGMGMELVKYVEDLSFNKGACRIKGKIFKANSKFLHILLSKLNYSICEDIPEEHSFIVKKTLEKE